MQTSPDSASAINIEVGPYRSWTIATTDAAIATEKPARVRTKGSVTETKPRLIP
jgi:hypothetical protein